ncbi:MAG: HNH endonuclease [Verrucomicrobia bacterium]|nr:HNH endonuclease [Verrucomicrobiota bacterium]
MQNADDAAATERIGYKGLGFKSVLDVCESARIYSGWLRVRFDREESKRALREKGLTKLTEVPVLRLPFWNDGDSDAGVDDLLLKGYHTAIVLPWKGGAVPKPFETEWKSICADASVLLLLHALEEVVWEGPRGERVEWRCRRDNDIELSVTASGHAPASSRWRICRGLEATPKSAVIIRLDDEGSPTRYPHDKIRVFFPTEEANPLPRMILHGQFDLQQNRKHVRPSGTHEEIVQSLARCAALALTEITDDGQFLDLLQPQITPENMPGLEREIWDAVSAVVRETTLPQSKVKLYEARLCPKDNAQDIPSDWQRERLDNWKTFKELLAKHRPGGLAGLNLLLPGTDTGTREKTVCAFNSNAHLTIEELKTLPLFPVASAGKPVATSKYHLFFPADKMATPVALPNVRIVFLQEEFSAECQKHKPAIELLKKLGVVEFSPSAIAAALAKSPLDGVPQETLWEFLRVTLVPMLKEEDAVIDWKDKHRQFLAEHVKVPCRNGVWVVAANVYAGQDWTRDDFLERAYGSNPQRSFLAAPPTGEEERKQFERLARWLGVGWSPKVLPIVNFEDKSETREGPRWQDGHFPVPNPPMRWQQHCAELVKSSQSDFNAYKARLRQDWTIDGDEKLLLVPGAFESIVREWKVYKPLTVIYYSANKKGDDDKQVRRYSSYVAHLFRHVAWIPVHEPAGLKAALDLFVKDCEVQREIPGWVCNPAAPTPDEVAKGIGIRCNWSEVTKADWERWLKGALDLNPQDGPSHQRITTLYQQALRRFGAHDQRLWLGDIWCIEKRSDNTSVWHREDSSKVYYADRPDLVRLRLKMLRIFPVELGWEGNKEKARQLFGVRPLSEHLCGKCAFTNAETVEPASKIRERLQQRCNCLAAYLKVKDKSWDAAESLTFRVGKDLQVRFFLDGSVLPFQPTPTFFQPASDQTRATLWLDAAENFTEAGQPRDIAWDEVGSALCYAAKLPLEYGVIFSNLLRCGEDSLKRMLLNLGLTETDVTNALPPKPQEPKHLQQSTTKSSELVAPEPAQPEHLHEKSGAIGEDKSETDGSILDEMAPDGDIPTRLNKLSVALAGETPERIETIVNRTVRRDTELIQTLKQFCEFRCQFPNCGIRISKRDGGYYIEVAHIKPMHAGGQSVLGNLLVLCPNHHKEFDHGHVEILEQSPELIHGKLNGKEFKITFAGAQTR